MLNWLLSWTALLASLVFLLPQVVRLVRTRDCCGVSPEMAGVGLVSCVGWGVFGATTNARGVVLAGVVGVIEYVGLCALLAWSARPRRVLRSIVMMSTAVGSAAAAGGLWGGRGATIGLGLALDGAVVAQYLPAVAEVRRVDDPSGVAVGTWILVAVTGLLWGGYGLTSRSVALVGYGAVLLLAAWAVGLSVTRPASRRRSSPHVRQGRTTDATQSGNCGPRVARQR